MLKWIEIDLAAVKHNLGVVRRLLGPASELLAVVKADGYGHGAERIARMALQAGATGLGVYTLEEATQIRKAGLRAPIFLLCPPLPEMAEEVVRTGAIPSLDSLELAAAIQRAARRRPRRKTAYPCVLEVDSGLGRWGIPPASAARFSESLSKYRSLRLESVSTHLDYLPGKNIVEAEGKLRRFKRLGTRLRNGRPDLKLQAANSAILADFPRWGLDRARIGNLIYGINRTRQPLPVRGPWTFKARITALKTISKGKSVGYGSEYLAPKRMRVATLPVGYSDGLTMEPRHRAISLGGAHQYWGWHGSRRVDFIGRCGISHVLVDVSEVRGARVGDVVTLPMRRTAANSRVPRVYVNSGR